MLWYTLGSIARPARYSFPKGVGWFEKEHVPATFPYFWEIEAKYQNL